MPRKSESPVIIRFLIEFILVNWRKDSPTDAAKIHKENKRNYTKREEKVLLHQKVRGIPTRPKSTQYNAANIGNGIDAKRAPNFPEGKTWMSTIFIGFTRIYQNGKPYPALKRISWIRQIFEPPSGYQLELVQEGPRSPLDWSKPIFINISIFKYNAPEFRKFPDSYTDTVEPVPVPNRPSSSTPIPCIREIENVGFPKHS